MTLQLFSYIKLTRALFQLEFSGSTVSFPDTLLQNASPSGQQGNCSLPALVIHIIIDYNISPCRL